MDSLVNFPYFSIRASICWCLYDGTLYVAGCNGPSIIGEVSHSADIHQFVFSCVNANVAICLAWGVVSWWFVVECIYIIVGGVTDVSYCFDLLHLLQLWECSQYSRGDQWGNCKYCLSGCHFYCFAYKSPHFYNCLWAYFIACHCYAATQVWWCCHWCCVDSRSRYIDIVRTVCPSVDIIVQLATIPTCFEGVVDRYQWAWVCQREYLCCGLWSQDVVNVYFGWVGCTEPGPVQLNSLQSCWDRHCSCDVNHGSCRCELSECGCYCLL